MQAGRLRGEIELRDVHFSYRTRRQEAVAGVSLAIAPGETVALVGQTGAGKSTLVKLIARFYDVTRGQVLIDGTMCATSTWPATASSWAWSRRSRTCSRDAPRRDRLRPSRRERRRGRGRGPRRRRGSR